MRLDLYSRALSTDLSDSDIVPAMLAPDDNTNRAVKPTIISELRKKLFLLPTLGDIFYAGTSGAVSKLAGNTTTTRKFLIQAGTGSASAAPSWDTLASGDLGTTLVPQFARLGIGTAADSTASLKTANDIITATNVKAAAYKAGSGTNSLTIDDGAGNMTFSAGTITFGGIKLSGVADPVSGTDAATKNYVDAVAQGLSVKPSARVATTAALAANTYANGSSGVGATLTGNSTGVLTVDGYTVALGDYVLVKDESTASHNGLFKCTTAGAVGVAYVLTRAVEMDATNEVAGAFVFVEGGTTNVSAGFVCTTTGTVTFGTTSISFTQFSGAGEITAGTGLSKSGNTLSIDSTIVTLSGSQTLTNKSISSGQITGLAASATTDATNASNISSGSLALGRIATIANNTILGNNAGSIGIPIALTASQTKTVLSLNNVENTALSTWAGSGSITTLGTISSGTVPAAHVSGLATVATTGAYDDLQGRLNPSTMNDLNWSRGGTSDYHPLTMNNDNGVVGYVSVHDSQTDWNTSSDARKKSALRPWGLGETFDKIPMGEFTWKKSGKVGHGTLAQELYKIFPDAVTVGGDDPDTQPWAVDYGKLTIPLIVEVQSLRRRVAELEARTAA